MNVKAIKTHKIVGGNLFSVLDKYVKKPAEGSVLAITSKIVSICEDRIVPVAGTDKAKLVRSEAQMYLEPKPNPYNLALTIKNNVLIPAAGIDESNANGFYILWPKDAQKTANEVREYFTKKFKLKKFGVIITDSRTTPLRYGTTGFALAHSGFAALRNYIGRPDIFGKKLKVTKANLMDGLASAAVLLMGEGKEQTPLALISDLPFVQFQKRNPTKLEIKNLKIDIRKDLYAPLLNSAPWKTGHRQKS